MTHLFLNTLDCTTHSDHKAFCLFYPKGSKCSKQRNSNFTNNQKYLFYFNYFTIVEIYRCVACMDASLKMRMHYYPRCHLHNLSLPGYKTDSSLRQIFKNPTASNSPTLKNSYCSAFLLRPKVKNLNTSNPLAHIYITLFPLS